MISKSAFRTLALLIVIVVFNTTLTFCQDANTTFKSHNDSEPFKYGLAVTNYGLEGYLNIALSKIWDYDAFIHHGGFRDNYSGSATTIGLRFNRYQERDNEFTPMLSLISGIDADFVSDSEVFDEGDYGHAIGPIDLVFGTEGGFQFNPTDKLHFRLTGGIWYITNRGFYPKVTFGVAYAF
jgi:hypothetical protein